MQIIQFSLPGQKESECFPGSQDKADAFCSVCTVEFRNQRAIWLSSMLVAKQCQVLVGQVMNGTVRYWGHVQEALGRVAVRLCSYHVQLSLIADE